MRERLNLKTWLPRLAWAGVVGLFVFLGSPLILQGATQDSVRLKVTPRDITPPAAVTDLEALATQNPGEAVLTWTAPDEDGGSPSGQAVQAYQVKLATFSIDSLAGDTTAWWSSATSTGVLFSPGLPGTAETVAYTLLPGTTYWFSLQSQDAQGNVSPLDVNSATPGAQAHCFTQVVLVDPPAHIFDLTGSSTAVPGEVRLTWTAPDQSSLNPQGLAVTRYEVRYATFSVDSLAADTNSWWTLASLLSGTPATPKPAGQGEVMTALLQPYTGYWFGVKAFNSQGTPSLIDAQASTPGTQVYVLTRSTDVLSPGAVSGHWGQVNLGVMSLGWSPVVKNADGTLSDDIVGYRVYEATSCDGPFNQLRGTYATPPLGGHKQALPAQDAYFRIVAYDEFDNESPSTRVNLIHVSPTGAVELMALSDDGSGTQVRIPGAHLPLMSEGNPLLAVVESNPTVTTPHDSARTLSTYEVSFEVAGSSAVDRAFHLSQMDMTLVLSYTAPGSPVPRFTADEVGVFWWNGAAWIRLGRGEVEAQRGTLAFQTSVPGLYQVRRYRAATTLTIDPSQVFPRIFSPNGDGQNDEVFFLIENPQASDIEGAIFDASGLPVADLKPALSGTPDKDAFSWDGRDRAGHIVPPGVYIYRIKGEGKVMTGSVVVAR